MEIYGKKGYDLKVLNTQWIMQCKHTGKNKQPLSSHWKLLFFSWVSDIAFGRLPWDHERLIWGILMCAQQILAVFHLCCCGSSLSQWLTLPTLPSLQPRLEVMWLRFWPAWPLRFYGTCPLSMQMVFFFWKGQNTLLVQFLWRGSPSIIQNLPIQAPITTVVPSLCLNTQGSANEHLGECLSLSYWATISLKNLPYQNLISIGRLLHHQLLSTHAFTHLKCTSLP